MKVNDTKKVRTLDSAAIARALGASEVIPLKAKTAAGRMAEGLWLWLTRRRALRKGQS